MSTATYCILTAIFITLLSHFAESCDDKVNQVYSTWNSGRTGALNFVVPETTYTGWTIEVTFDKDVTGLQV